MLFFYYIIREIFGAISMILNDNVPTVFARTIAEAAGLLSEMKMGQNHAIHKLELERLKCFQQMAITSKVEDARIAYHGVELSEEQIEALAVIYKSTRPWMLGHVVGVLLDKLDNKNMANKDFAESVRTIVEQLTKTDEGAPTEKLKGMLVTLTGRSKDVKAASN